ncbi:MAG: hypothetical protein HYS74_01375 [Parcubacteria group bacterium]|nr:hypothetical protein [Parcubacteria group bacterium]
MGPIVGIALIIIVLALGGFYFWGKELVQQGDTAEIPAAADVLQEADAQLESLNQQGTSDEVQAIENDLTATDLDGLDAELKQIEAELKNL